MNDNLEYIPESLDLPENLSSGFFDTPNSIFVVVGG